MKLEKIYLVFLLTQICLINCQLTASEQIKIDKAKLIKKEFCSKDGITNISLVSQSEKDQYDSQLNEIRKVFNNKNQIEDMLMKQEFEINMENAQRYVVKPMVFIVFAALSILLFILYFICCCCPCCQSKCCKQQEPYSKFSYLWPVFGAIISLLWIVGAGVAGLAQSGGISETAQKIDCAAVTITGDVAFGFNYTNIFYWKGLEGLNDQINTLVQKDLQGFSNTFANKLGPSQNIQWDQMKDDISQLGQDLQIPFQDSNNQSYFYNSSPNPNITGGYKSQFFHSIIFTTFQDDINNKLENIIDALNSVVDIIQESSNQFLNIKDQFESISKDSLSQVTSSLVSMTDIIISYDEDAHKPLNYVFSTSKNVQLGIYGGFLGIALLAIFIIILISFCKKVALTNMLNFCWIFFQFFVIFIFIISGLILLINLIGFDTCEVVNKSLNEQGYFPKLHVSNSNFNDFYDNAKTCKIELGGDGDFIKKFDISQYLDPISQVTNQSTFFLTDQVLQDTTSDLNNFNTQTNQITDSLQEIIDSGIFGTFQESSALLGVVDTINKCTNGQQNNPSFKICYVLSNNCKDQAKTTTTDIYIGKNDQNYLKSNQNYFSNFNACSDSILRNESLTNLLTWRNEKTQTLTPILTKFQNFQTKVNLYNQEIIDFRTNLNDLLTQTNDIIKLITDTQTGILSGLNCLFIGKNLQMFYDVVCVSFMTDFWMFSKAMFFLSFGMFFSAFFLQCTIFRIKNQEKLVIELQEAQRYNTNNIDLSLNSTNRFQMPLRREFELNKM